MTGNLASAVLAYADEAEASARSLLTAPSGDYQQGKGHQLMEVAAKLRLIVTEATQ